jgi:sugar phosphate permease
MLILIISTFHWQAAFFVLAAFNLFINIPMFLFLTRNTPEEHPRLSKEEVSYIRQKDEANDAEQKQFFAKDYRYWIVWFGNLMSSFYSLNQHLAANLSR